MSTDLPRTIHLSASAVAAFKACPTRWRYGYVEGIRLDEDTESQRVGTNWHKLHEVYNLALAEMGVLPLEGPERELLHETAFDAAIAHLNEVYKDVPISKDAIEWEIERTILAVSFAAYYWYYKADPIATLATEVSFKLPLHHPKTGLPLAIEDVVRVGKIDRLVRHNGRVHIRDYKSTSKSIDADSDFWSHLRLDTQISMYVMAAIEMCVRGDLSQYGVDASEQIAGAFYDVWRKPKFSPKMLTQGDTKVFLELGDYMGEKFERNCIETEGNPPLVTVNGQLTEVEVGKKGFAIRETPAMFGARLLKELCEHPELYFARKDIPRTAADIKRFRGQLYSCYQSMKAARDSGHFIENEHSCMATFKCPYIPICFHGVQVKEGEAPSGFKRIFTKLTHETEHVEI